MTLKKQPESNADFSPRIIALLIAEQTLMAEGIVTSVVRYKIKNRIAELLETNRDEAEKMVLEYLSRFHAEVSEAANQKSIKIPELPFELSKSLCINEAILVGTLLNKHGYIISSESLMKVIWDEEICDAVAPSKLRVLVFNTNKKIQGWGKISAKQGRGYWLEILDK
ncbi:MAG: hypothetical protein ABII07_04810 [Patescibacteria group bacterium]|nr:hypothetical protein [Patescibacteria group bacterium]